MKIKFCIDDDEKFVGVSFADRKFGYCHKDEYGWIAAVYGKNELLDVNLGGDKNIKSFENKQEAIDWITSEIEKRIKDSIEL